MNPIHTFDSSYEFIELHRTFHELSERSGENDDIDRNRFFRLGHEPLRWPGLIKEYRVVILSEAGSGKTFEIRHIARTLRAQGENAFFLRLEHIPEDFEDAFEVGTYKDFEEWLASGEEGWILLDSVDEARLRHPRDFELAIRKLSNRITTAYDRAHLVISSRPTAWRPKTDLAYCEAHLPYGSAETSESTSSNDDDSSRSIKTKKTTSKESRQVFKIVALDDLTSDQIEVFVKAKGIKDSKAFLDAVERADAWSFTARPQDLEELTEFWIDKGRIGTRLELMRNSIGRRLIEPDQGRAETRPLSLERARLGARLLAAATTLTQNSTIRVPDGVNNTKGIAIQSVLPDWNDSEQYALLLRPIFDEAIYRTVRFHHRSVREYLTAEWFAELLKHETSRRTIEGLFFRNQYGLDIVVPAIRPILPWLIILDEKIRERVRKVEPEVIFEGGDPSQLPLKIRRHILREVCEQMASGIFGRSMRDYRAVQRFANPDLADDVRSLIRRYASNEDLIAFLLEMVWLGELSDALPEAMGVALTPNAEYYTRTAAFRAVKAIGSHEDNEKVRQSFLNESPKLKREWLAELLKDVQPSEQTLVWLLACLEKSEPKERYSIDHLKNAVTEFAGSSNVKLLPQLISGMNKLLSSPPLIERRYCEVSEKFQWLIAPASEALKRLISTHHPFSLEPDALLTLHKISELRGYGSDELSSDARDELSKLIASWRELNRALFWFEVQHSREAIDKKRGERLIDYRRVSFGGSFWRFGASDFEYVAEEISRRKLLDDRLVALSLAFNLYKAANRPRRWRERLKKLVASNNVLSDRLRTYLMPPAQTEESRKLKQQEAKWKRRNEASRKEQEKRHADWKKYLNENLDDDQATLRKKPGSITNSMLYLFEKTREGNTISDRWTEYNWKSLIPEFGDEVAHFYRDATVSFWRHHKPKLRSEGASSDTTPYAVIFGLIGLEIEAIETSGWFKNLDAAEVERACRYASFELNGFPTWFPKLFEAHPNIVSDFLMQEIRYELSIEKSDSDAHYILSDVSWSGQWAWDQVSLPIYEILKREPKNFFNLDRLLKILQGSALPDDQIEKLASRKCRTLKKPKHLARWYAVWTGVAPEDALLSLRSHIEEIADPEVRTIFAMIFITHLLGVRGGEGAGARGAFETPGHLKSLYLLMHDHIRREEDITHEGTYTPGLRDDAQDARNSLFNSLDQISGKESFLALMEIAEVHPEKSSRPWISLRAKKKAEQDGDMEAWSPAQVREFHEQLERTPCNHRELAELAVLRLLDLKDDLEHGDSSITGILRTVTQEPDMRKYIGRELREKAFGRYSIPQEEEFADAKKPDLRFHGANFDGPVPVELKLADKWTGPALFERLENQLCGDYLRDNRSNRGIFLLVYRGEKAGWDVPGSGNRVDFVGLPVALQDHWGQISLKFPKIDDITVIGIDLTKRSD